MKLIIGLIKVWDVKTDLGAPGHPQQRGSDGERHAQGIMARQFPRGSGLWAVLGFGHTTKADSFK